MCTSSGGPRRALDLLELELQGLLTLMWVLGKELGSSARPASAPNLLAMSPAPVVLGFAPECRQITQLAADQLGYGQRDEKEDCVGGIITKETVCCLVPLLL